MGIKKRAAGRAKIQWFLVFGSSGWAVYGNCYDVLCFVKKPAADYLIFDEIQACERALTSLKYV